MLTDHMAQDLCERHEKGVLHEHQKALQKYSVMKRQMMSATVQPKEQVSVEHLESRIVQVSLLVDTFTLEYILHTNFLSRLLN